MKPKILQKEGAEVTPEVLAQAIVDVADGARKLLSSRLTMRTLCVLIRDEIGVGSPSLKDIEKILTVASELDSACLKR